GLEVIQTRVLASGSPAPASSPLESSLRQGLGGQREGEYRDQRDDTGYPLHRSPPSDRVPCRRRRASCSLSFGEWASVMPAGEGLFRGALWGTGFGEVWRWNPT